MKELLRQLATYNVWANQKLCEVILALPPDQQAQEVCSSFTSLRSTLQHMWDAESIWWQRLKLQENVVAPGTSFSGTTQELIQGMQQQNKQWEEWVSAATEMALDHVFSYYNSKREHFKQPTYQVCLQVMTHGSYHRGQLVNILRQLGVQKIPQTDYIIWSRKK